MSADDARTDPWAEFLDPEKIRPRLVGAAVYLAGYEVLRNSIIDRIRTFFMSGLDESGLNVDSDYQTEVLNRNKSPLYASLSWLEQQGVIDQADLQAFEKLKAARNRIAHELASIAYGSTLSSGRDEWPALIALVNKIEKWWIVNFELEMNPSYRDMEIDEDGILPGPVMALGVLETVALGTSDEARVFLDGVVAAWRKDAH